LYKLKKIVIFCM